MASYTMTYYIYSHSGNNITFRWGSNIPEDAIVSSATFTGVWTGNGTVSVSGDFSSGAVSFPTHSSVEVTKSISSASSTYSVSYNTTGSMTFVTATVAVTYTMPTYRSVTYTQSTGGTISGNNGGYAGNTISVTATPDPGYELVNIKVNGSAISGTSFTMPDSNVTVTATWQGKMYTITKASTSNGSFTCPTQARYGSMVTVNVTPNSGYELDWVGYNGTPISDTSFTMPANDIIVNVVFKKKTHNISYENDGHGSCSGPSSATVGSSVSFTVTPDTGYRVKDVNIYAVVMGGMQSLIGTGTSISSMPDSDLLVNATFERQSYTITYTGDDYFDHASGPSSAYYGDNVSISAYADTGHYIANIKVNGSIISGSSFTMPAQDTTVYVSTDWTDYTITKASTTNGSFTCPTQARYESMVTVSVTPDDGYELDYVEYNDTPISGTSFTMPANDIIVNVVFKKTTYSISYENDGHGSCSGPSSATVGSPVSFTVTPDTGYRVKAVNIYGLSAGTQTLIGTGTSISSMPDSDLLVNATFERQSYTITYTGDDYFDHASGPSSAYYGDNVSISAYADTGHYITNIKVNGSIISGSSFTMPAQDTTVYVSTDWTDYTITKASTTNGSFTCPSTAHYGDTININVTPNSGYILSSISVSGGVGTLSGTSFTMPASDVTVTVTFEATAGFNISIVSGSSSLYYDTYDDYTTTCRAEGIYTSGGSTSIKTCTWTTSNSSVATVSGGTITPHAVGTARITGSWNGYSDYVDITVTACTYGLTVSPKSATLYDGEAQQLTAKFETYRGSTRVGNDICTASASWSSSATSKATVSSGGLVTAVATGSATITATYRGKSDTCAISTEWTDYTITKASTTNGSFTCPSTAHYGDIVNIDVSPNSGYILSSISVSGGVGTLSGTSFTMPASNVTVTVAFEVAPGFNVSIVSGSSSLYYDTYGDYTTTCRAEGIYTSSGSTSTKSCTWTTSNSSVATVSGGTITPVGAGSARITGSWNGYSDYVNVTVTACTYGLVVTPGSITLYDGETQQLTAKFETYRGSTRVGNDICTASASWSSNATSKATVSGGLVTAIAAGSTTITASYRGKSDTCAITTKAKTYELILSKSSITDFYVGETQNLTATYRVLRDSSVESSTNVTTSASWSSSATSKATVSNTSSTKGKVTAVAAGSATITVTYDGLTASCSVEVSDFNYALQITPVTISLTSGDTHQLTATYKKYRGGSAIDSTTVTSSASWSTSSSSRASVSSDGLVTAENTAGSVTITATYNGKTATCAITVTLRVISTTYGNPTVTVTTSDIPAIGGTITTGTISYVQVKTITYSDNSTSTSNITGGGNVTWGSPVTAGAAAMNQARHSVGTLTATVSLNGKTGSGSATVYQAANTEALGTLAISADPGTVVIGHDPASLIAIITYPAGQTSNVTRDTVFQSSDTSIATVSGSSVTGVGIGTVIITGTYIGKTATTSLQSGTEAEMTSLLIVENTTPELGVITVSGAVDVNDIYKPSTDADLSFKCSEFNNKGGTSSSDVTTLYYGTSASTDTGSSNVYYNIGNNISDTDTFSSDNITLQYYIDEEDGTQSTSYATAAVYFNGSRLGYVEMLPAANKYVGQFSYDDVYKPVSRTLTSLLGGSSQNVTGLQLKSLHWRVGYGWYGIRIGTTLKVTSQVASTDPKNYYSTYYGSNPSVHFYPNTNCYVKSAISKEIEFGTKSQAIASFNISDISSNYSGIGSITSLVERNHGYSSSTNLTADCTAVGNITSIDIYFRPTTSVNETLFANLATAKSCTFASVYVKIYRNNETYLSTGTAQLFNGNVAIGTAVTCQTTTSYTVVPLPLDQAIDLMKSPDFHVHLEWSCVKTTTNNGNRRIYAYGAGVDLTCLVTDMSDYTTLFEADVTSQVINDVYTYPVITSMEDRVFIAGFADATGKFYNKMDYMDSSTGYNITGYKPVKEVYKKINGTWELLSDMYQGVIKPLSLGEKFKRIGYNITPITFYDYIRTDGTGYIEIPFEDCPYIPGQSALQIAFSKVDGGYMNPTGTSAATVLDWGDSGCYIQFTSSDTSSSTPITLTTNYLNNVNGTLYKYTGAKSKVTQSNYEVLMVRSWGQGTSSNANTCGFLYKGNSTLLELPEIWSTTGATETSASNTSGTWTPSNENLQVLGYHSNGVAYPTSTISGFTLYAFNVYRSTTATSGSDTDVNLEHAFRPAAMRDSVGLYDTVTGSYYPGIGGLSVGNWGARPLVYNNGNGSIVNYGVVMPLSDVTILGTQIQSSSDSTTYINTGVSYGPNNKYVIEYEGLHIATTGKYMGWNGGGCIQKVSGMNSPYGDGTNTYTSDNGMKDIHVTQTIERGTFSNTITEWDYPVGYGGTTTRTHESLRRYATDPLCLFASVSEGITPLKNAKLSSAKIYVNDILVRDFISAQKNSDGTIGMYDRVNGRFYALDAIGGTGGE